MIFEPGLSIVNQLVCRASKVTQFGPNDIKGPSHYRSVAYVRFAVMDVARRQGLSLGQIGRALNRHHTTVMDGIKRAAELRGDPDFSALLHNLEAE